MWFLVPLLASLPVRAADTWDLARSLRADGASAMVAAESRDGYIDLVENLAAAATKGDVPAWLSKDAEGLGYVLVVKADRMELRPASTATRGNGVLVMRLGELPAEVMIAAPHAFDDIRTGEIASDIFESAPIRGLFVATNRRDMRPGTDGAHEDGSALQLATEAFAMSLPSPWFIQLHGYGPGTTQAGAVISGGASGTPRAMLERAADVLSTALGGADIRTSRDVPALAALTNVQGAWLRGKGRFIHVELGFDVRETMSRHPVTCRMLATGLVAMAEAYRDVGLAPDPTLPTPIGGTDLASVALP